MDEVRIGIVGMGQRTCHHGGCLFSDCKEDVRIAAVCDIRPERLGSGRAMYEEEFGYSIAGYADFVKMYDEAGLDGVFVAGPNGMHRDMVVPAFERGLHVLCEKPMDITLARCDEMIAAAAKSGKVLGLGMQMRYRRHYHKVKEILESGEIGAPAMVWCTEYRGPFGEMKDWVWTKAVSGGAIVEKNCHHYDIINLWLDSEPTTVYASGNILKHGRPYGLKSEIVDNAWIVNDFANGTRAMVGVCFLAKSGHAREFGLIGTEGRVFFSNADQEVLHVDLNSGERRTYRINETLRGGMAADFVRAVRTGEPTLVTPEMGKQSLLVPLAAEKSIEEKRAVHVSELA